MPREGDSEAEGAWSKGMLEKGKGGTGGISSEQPHGGSQCSERATVPGHAALCLNPVLSGSIDLLFGLSIMEVSIAGYRKLRKKEEKTHKAAFLQIRVRF